MDNHIQRYDDSRNRVVRFSGFLAVTSLMLAVIARSPKFRVKEFFGLIEGNIHNGYVMVYGPFVILLMAAWYAFSLFECLAFRESIFDEPVAQQSGLSRTQAFLVRLPFQWRGSALAGVVSALLPMLITTVSYVTLLVEFLRCTNCDDESGWPWDLLLGIEGFRGYRACWGRHPEPDMPWIYPPFQTWAYLCGALVLAWLTIYLPRRLYKERCGTGGPRR